LIKWSELKNPVEIAEGGFGKIYIAKWRETYVAVKVLKSEFHNESSL
jgi:predicted Ser/Thr protein kinase